MTVDADDPVTAPSLHDMLELSAVDLFIYD
jgi:hypothetical protein